MTLTQPTVMMLFENYPFIITQASLSVFEIIKMDNREIVVFSRDNQSSFSLNLICQLHQR
jgi:hypothetical protein